LKLALSCEETPGANGAADASAASATASQQVPQSWGTGAATTLASCGTVVHRGTHNWG